MPRRVHEIRDTQSGRFQGRNDRTVYTPRRPQPVPNAQPKRRLVVRRKGK